jgi:ribosomal peptide maturation radical SAM protein 1
MPCAAVERPPLGITLLREELLEAGVQCDVAYLHLGFARLLGLDDYRRLVYEVPYLTLACEWAFAAGVYDGGGPPDVYEDRILRGRWGLDRDAVDLVRRARDLAPRFVEQALRGADWGACDVVGFTTTAFQNLASLALARRIKAAHPHVVIAFGGPAWEGVMGRELLRRHRFVDVAFSGEADHSFRAFVLRLAAGRSPEGVGGVIWRRDGRVCGPLAEARPVDLESLPAPRFADFFAALGTAGLDRSSVAIPVEGSRGCWWAARRACTFCGLSGCKRSYRAKSAARTLAELRGQAARHPGLRLELVDNVVSHEFLREALPELAARPLGVPLALAVRPTVSRRQVRLAAAAGVELQAGIESLSDPSLRRMGKGTDALRNLRLLRWCRESGVPVEWNYLHSLPGESTNDYAGLAALLPRIRFLPPPAVRSTIIVERHSAYFRRPGQYGLRRVFPAPEYAFVYPFPRQSLGRIAYFFEYPHASEVDAPACVRRLAKGLDEWMAAPQRGCAGELRSVAGPEGRIRLTDARRGDTVEVELEDVDADLYRACDGIGRLPDLERLVAAGVPPGEDVSTDVARRLRSLVDRGFLATAGDRYLSLALQDGA